jgi:anti-sigma regulatory factor (Ser/Thr protein kinase)
MVEPFSQSFVIEGNNFYNAGKASTEIKLILKELGIDSKVIRRVAIATYEAEMNVVMYTQQGVLTFEVTPRTIRVVVNDLGPGIPDIELALKEGYSTATEKMREMGFGAGMGLPNIKKNSDEFKIESAVGKGTTVEFTVYIN